MSYKVNSKNQIIFNLLLVLAVFIVSSCSSEAWNKEEQGTFIDECIEEGGSKSYCTCFMNKTMEEYPIYEDSKEIKFEEAVELSKNCD